MMFTSGDMCHIDYDHTLLFKSGGIYSRQCHPLYLHKGSIVIYVSMSIEEPLCFVVTQLGIGWVLRYRLHVGVCKKPDNDL